jgi:hypothetical protein
MSMPLPGSNPEAWLATHLAAHLDARGGPIDSCDASSMARWFTVDQLLAHNGAAPREIHSRLMSEEGLPARAAATYLAGWIGGALADAIGFALAGSGAGFLVSASSVRWHQHPLGWMDRVDLGTTRVVVANEHPWSGQSGVDTVGDAQIVRELTVLALVAVVTPIIDFCHSLARVGRGGLWNEVGDSLGMAMTADPSVPVTHEIVDTLAAAVRASGCPWKARPTVRIANTATGPVYVGQKGGCCLAYTRSAPPVSNIAELDGAHRAYLERFPEEGRRYCTTCSLRDFADCETRQLFWRECTRESSTT